MRACVVGAGMMGRNHVRVLGEMAGVELVAVADQDPANLHRVLRGREARGYTDHLELLAAEQVELTVVAVPTRSHEEVVEAALVAGSHVLVENPVAEDLDGAERMGKLADEAGLLVSVGHVERFNPAVLELRRRLAAGELGAVFQVTARRTGPFPSRVRDVGVVKDLAAHDVDVVHFALDSPFEFLFAQVARHVHTCHEDLVSAVGRLRNGAITVFDVSWLTPTKVRELTVVGEGGMFVADYLRQDLTLYRNGHHDDQLGPLSNFTGVSEGDMVRYAVERREPLRAELEAMTAAIRTAGPPPVPIREAAESLVVIDSMLRSADLDQPVRPAVGAR
ncbi:MAG TPA: Gfo/Idh/MocA family oxidoreductase [Acidimicrobiales bacterium]|nr:Gfo/Idh/MocA family oxidoreductase [Acidimicrobiales bacterium]